MCNNQTNRASANAKVNANHNTKNVKGSFTLNICGEQNMEGSVTLALPDGKSLKLSFDNFKSSGNCSIEFNGWTHMNSNR